MWGSLVQRAYNAAERGAPLASELAAITLTSLGNGCGTGSGDATTPVLTTMTLGFDVLIPIALLALSVAITIWVLLMPAAVITASYGPGSPQTMSPTDTKTFH